MEFRRALRILAARWWVIALGGVIGIIVAIAAADFVNDRIVDEFEARANVDYVKLESESDDGFTSRLSQARSSALGLLDAPSQRVTVDGDTGVLTFSMTGSDPEAMIADVTRLRQEFLSLESEQVRFEEITTAELARLQTEIDDVREQLRSIEPPPPQFDPATEAEREQLGFEINSVRQRIASLRIQLAFPELATADSETLQADLDRSQELLVRLTAGRDALPSPSTTPTTQGLDTLVLQRHLQDLESRYVSFSLGLLEQPDVVGPISPAIAIDNTRDPISPELAAAFGLAAGIFTSTAGLLILDRVRRTVWTTDDLAPLTVVGVIDRGRPGANGGAWYPGAGPAQRRRQIQAFRAALDPVVGDGPVSVGLAGVSVPQHDVQALAADLASSVAASGTRVLLVDACFETPSELPEFGDDGPTLAELLSARDGIDSAATIKQALSERSEVLPNLVALPAGSEIEDATDALASPNLRSLLSTASELDDLVIVAAAPFGDPGTDVLTQRLDHVVLVTRARRTTRRDYVGVVEEMSSRSAALSGVALLTGRASKRSRSKRRILAGFRGYGRHTRGAGDDDVASTASDQAASTDDDGYEGAIAPDELVEREPPSDLADGAREESSSFADDRAFVVSDVPGVAGSDSDAAQSTYTTEGYGGMAPRPEAQREPIGQPQAAPSERGRHARMPGERDVVHGTLSVDAAPDSDLEVVVDLRDASEEEQQAAERYLVRLVLEILGVDGERQPSTAVDDGMVLITPEDGAANVAELLQQAVDEDEPARESGIERGLMAILGGRMSAWQLHRWVESRFFDVYAQYCDGSPEVWHLTSSDRTFQALVRADVFDADHIQLLRAQVRRMINRLGEALADAGRVGDMDRVEAIEARFNEVRSFDSELFGLWTRGWQTGGALDRGAKLAVLHRLGVVEVPGPRPSSPDVDLAP